MISAKQDKGNKITGQINRHKSINPHKGDMLFKLYFTKTFF